MTHDARESISPVPHRPTLGEAWSRTLASLASAQRWPTVQQPEKLAPLVQAVSQSYNAGVALGGLPPAHLAARLGFFFPRDVLKCHAAVLALAATLGAAPRALRWVDLGAGLGASALGAIRAVRALGWRQPIHLLAVDADGPALALAKTLLTRAVELEPALAPLHIEVRAHDLRQPLRLDSRADLVFCAQTLCELDRGVNDEDRARRHARLLADWRRTLLGPSGQLVVVEPALAETARHLQRVREALVAELGPPVWPCTHAQPCPMLPKERHWCHQDADVDLPNWLQPVARAAGLRWQGLSWSAMVWGGVAQPAPPLWQVVSERLERKGQSSVWLCGAGQGAARLVQLNRQNRDAASHNADWERLRRGVRVRFQPELEVSGEQVRLGKDARVLAG